MSCQITEFNANIQRMRIKREDRRTYIGLIYQTNTVSINEENLVYDILTFIGTVGGSLGLFIGCSFYDFCRLLEKKSCKNLKHEEKFIKEESVMQPNDQVLV